MDREMREHAATAIERLERVIAQGAAIEHAEVRAAAAAVIAFRNRAIVKHRSGAVDRACLDAANSLLSLAYGAEFPLSGLHVHRFEQTRDGMKKLLGDRAS